MRIWAIALCLASGCDQRIHHLGDTPGDANGDGANGSDGSGSNGSGGSGTPALGCDLADVMAQCPAMFEFYTDNTFAECGSNMVLGSGATPRYSYNNNDFGDVVTYDRTLTFTCGVGSDGTRNWTPGFTDDCNSIPANGTDFSQDHTGAQFETLPGTCPSGQYDVTMVEPGNTGATGMTTCEVPATTAFIATTGCCGSGCGSGSA